MGILKYYLTKFRLFLKKRFSKMSQSPSLSHSANDSVFQECKAESVKEAELTKESDEKASQMSISESIFYEISALYNNLSEKHDYKLDTFDNGLLYIESCIKECAVLKNKINEYLSSPMFYESLCNHKVKGFSFFTQEIKELHMLIFDHDTEESIKSKLAEIPNELCLQFEKSKEKLLLDKDFLDEINSLEKSNIAFTKPEALVSSIENLETIKYSNITAKTNYERLGNFVSIDIETTGLSHIKDKIIEISAINFEYWEPTKIFTTLINPKIPIPDKIINLTGITDEMVKDAPSFEDIICDLASFIGSKNIVGHNLEFDLKFLFFNGLNISDQKRKYYDTLQIAKKTLKSYNEKRNNIDYDVDNYKLTTLCDYYKIRGNLYAHRADSDCMAAGYLLKNLAKDKISK